MPDRILRLLDVGQAFAVMVAGTAAAVVAGAVGYVTAAVTDGDAVVTGTVLTAVIGFAGLLIRQMYKSQREVWRIVEDEREQRHKVTWERDVAWFRLYPGMPDPGPYVPRKPNQQKGEQT